MKLVRWAVAFLLLILAVVVVRGAPAPAKFALPDSQVDDTLASVSTQASVVLAAGCFWGVEEVFQHVRGVTGAVSGYAGGTPHTANYQLVSMGSTEHAEAVKVTFDPSKISYGQLLKIFFAVAHDPTQRGGQGPDVGPQYRSGIFYASERQQEIAKAYVEQLTGVRVFGRDITTEIVPLTAFYDAEAYHQDYASKHPNQPYIVINDLPKVHELRKQFPELYVK